MSGVIAICGIDGSGKTTQVKLLEKYLSRKGFKVKRIWFRWVTFLSYPFLAMCRILGYTKWRTIDRSGVRHAERMFYTNRALARIWPWLLIIDAFVHTTFRVAIWRLRRYVVLCDRFIPDVLVDLMCETKDYELPRRVVGRMLLTLIPKSAKLILIDVTEGTAYSRKSDIPSVSYLKERRRLYLYLAKALNIPTVNGEKKVSEVHKSILGFLNTGINKGCEALKAKST